MNNIVHKDAIPKFTGKLKRPPVFYRQWMLARNPALFFDRLVEDYGDFIHYKGLIDFYMVNHPELVNKVLKQSNRNFDKRTIIYKRFKNVQGSALVVAEGESWKRQRRMMQPIFKKSAIEKFFDIMVDAPTNLAQNWTKRADSKVVFNIAEDMNHLALEIIGRALFSNDFVEMRDKIEYWTSILNRYSAKSPLPIIRDLWFPSPRNFKMKSVLRDFHRFLGKMVSCHRQSPNAEGLLGILMQVTDEETGECMPDQALIDEMLSLVMGGHETVATVLTWFWYELGRNPEVEKRFHQEIDTVLGKQPISPEKLTKLTYTKQVIEETMRLHPPLWFENRNVKNDVELGGVQLKQGDMVVLSRYSLHRNPQFWHKPDKFDPGRFDKDKPENSKGSCAFIPFSSGPRMCLGMQFATMELITVVVTIARRYRIIIDESDKHEMAAHLTMSPKYGVKVRLENRL